MTRVTDDELLSMRDLLRHYKTFDDEGGDLCFEVENKILEGEDSLLSICDELLMLRASVRLQAGATGARQEFSTMAPHVKLPLHISDAEGGWVVDSAGLDVAYVNDDGPAKEHADGVVAMIVLAVNTCAGFRVEAGG